MVVVEFVIGATAAGTAVIFTNPLEVVKTRYQLQGELQIKGQYKVHYTSILQTFLQICKHDGMLGLQKGLYPAFIHQLFLNGTRLGLYQVIEDKRLIHNTINGEEKISLLKAVIGGVIAGSAGAFIGSPFYLIKTHLQSKAHTEIAVGYQHDTNGVIRGLVDIYRKYGFLQLWRGATGAVIRVAVGSAAQFSCFMMCKEYFVSQEILKPDQKILNAFGSSMIGGVAVALVMSPFDLISTRLYNQGIDKDGKGLFYRNYFDCAIKTMKAEGISGLYKGVLPCYLRIGPHTVLSLMFWDIYKDIFKKYFEET